MTVIEVVVRYRVGLWMFVGMVVAGWCPFVAFIAEHYVTLRLTSGEEYQRWVLRTRPCWVAAGPVEARIGAPVASQPLATPRQPGPGPSPGAWVLGDIRPRFR